MCHRDFFIFLFYFFFFKYRARTRVCSGCVRARADEITSPRVGTSEKLKGQEMKRAPVYIHTRNIYTANAPLIYSTGYSPRECTSAFAIQPDRSTTTATTRESTLVSRRVLSWRSAKRVLYLLNRRERQSAESSLMTR